jgi:fumarate hydratase class II
MLVTALSPRIGYDKAAKIAKDAHKNGTTLKEEVIKSKILSEKEYDKIMNPMLMTKPK